MYEERLLRLGLTTLKERSERGDLIEQVDFFWPQNRSASQSVYNLRGHSLRLERQLVKGCEERSNLFSNRGVNPWNALSESAVNAQSVNNFKDKVDKLRIP